MESVVSLPWINDNIVTEYLNSKILIPQPDNHKKSPRYE